MLCLLLFALVSKGFARDKDAPDVQLLGHRGGALYLIPEHSVGSYSVGAQNGADYLEPDLVVTKDDKLLCLHGSELSRTTNVASLPQYKDRKTTIHWLSRGKEHSETGWFSENFTLAEIQALQLRTAMYPTTGPGTLDGYFHLLEFSEMLALVKKLSHILQRPIGVYPETKIPQYFRSIGLPMEKLVIDELLAAGFLVINNGSLPEPTLFNVTSGDTRSKVLLQSFNPDSARRLKNMTKDVPIFQLVGADDLNANFTLNLTEKGLKEISTYAHGIGLPKEIAKELVERNNKLQKPLSLHEYTLGQDVSEYQTAFSLGLNGVFSNDVDTGRVVRKLACESFSGTVRMWILLLVAAGTLALGLVIGFFLGRKFPSGGSTTPSSKKFDEMNGQFTEMNSDSVDSEPIP